MNQCEVFEISVRWGLPSMNLLIIIIIQRLPRLPLGNWCWYGSDDHLDLLWLD